MIPLKPLLKGVCLIVSNSYTRIWMKAIRFGNAIIFKILFIKHASLQWLYFYVKLLQSKIIFKQKNNHKVSCIKIFAWIFLQLPIQKNIIPTLCIITIEKSELTFLLLLYFHFVIQTVVKKENKIVPFFFFTTICIYYDLNLILRNTWINFTNFVS